MNKETIYYIESSGSLYKCEIYKNIGYFHYYNNFDKIWSKSMFSIDEVGLHLREITDEAAFAIMLEMERMLTSNYAQELVKQLFK